MSSLYRYGYQGSEKDDEIKGNGNSYTTEFRMLDPRLGRWLSIDPMTSSFPWQSPYCTFDNNPIMFNDPSGLAAQGGPGDGDKKTFSGPSLQEVAQSAQKNSDAGGLEWGTADGQTFNGPYSVQGASKQAESLGSYLTSGPSYIDLPEVNIISPGINSAKKGKINVSFDQFLQEGREYAGKIDYTNNFINNLKLNSMSMAQKAEMLDGPMDPCDGFWQSFIGFGLNSGTSQVNRVFWSGEFNVAGKAAADYAVRTGGTTLEMTTTGKVLTKLTDATSFTLTKPLWKQASKSFARGANGKVTVFHNATNGISINPIWKTEYGLLKSQGTEINYINVFK